MRTTRPPALFLLIGLLALANVCIVILMCMPHNSRGITSEYEVTFLSLFRASEGRVKASAQDDDTSSRTSEARKTENRAPDREDATTTQQAEAAQEDEKEEPLNILLLYADDWTMKTLGILNEYAKTSNLDAMARNGMFFRNNCVVTSVCWNSRATFITGQYGSVHGMTKVKSETVFAPGKWNQTLFTLLKEHGYYTGLMGKWHAPWPDEIMEQAFDKSKTYYGDHWLERDGVMRHVTDLNKQDGLEFLRERPRDRKFALKVSFFATHAQDHMTFPQNWEPMYETIRSLYVSKNESTFPLPKTSSQEHWDNAMPWFMHDDINYARSLFLNRFDPPKRFQISIRNIYRMAAEVDQACGELIQELKDQGVLNSTLILFTTDNGMLHGEHGLAEKWYAFEESIKVPLIIQDPRMPASSRGNTNYDFTLSIDIAPTVLSAAKIPVPSVMQGRDMSQLYLGAQEQPSSASSAAAASSSLLNEPWREDFFYEWTLGGPNAINHTEVNAGIFAVFALVRRDSKYMYWPSFKYEQLFNTSRDPYEEYDIYNETAQTNKKLLEETKARYAHLKKLSQGGHRV